jgi:sulfur relay (sulfurtransferase) DsrF/TusC family protein
VIDAKSIESTLASLPLYDIDTLYADQASLDDRGLTLENLVDGVAGLSPAQLRDVVDSHDQVLVF